MAERMSIEEAIKINAGSEEAKLMAFKSLEALNELEEEIRDKLTGDKRTLTRQKYSPENDYYYDGVFDTYKIIKKYIDKIEILHNDL